MFPFRNGSLPANALLIAIGAAAGVGMSRLAAPLAGRAEPAVGKQATHPQPVKSQKPGGTSHRAKPQPALMAEVLQIEDPRERAESLRDIGAAAAESDPGELFAEIANLTSEQDKLEFLRGVYSVWGESDPVAALDYAKSNLPAGLARSETIGIAVNKWASHNPRAAWQWSEANLAGPLKEQAFTDVLVGWTRKAPAAASQWLASTGYNSQPLVNAVATTWAEQSPQAAAIWAAVLPDPESAHAALVSVASEWTTQHPQEAAEHFTPEISKPDGAPLAIPIAQNWGTTDPAATSAWVNQLPAGPGKDEAAATLAIVWAASDVNAAVAWSNSLTDEAVRQQVITHIGTTWGAIDPDAALEWLHSLPSPLAADAVTGAFNSWAGTDPVGLREVVDGSPASPEMDIARLALADVLAATDISSSISLAFGISSPTGRDDAAARYFRQWRKFDDASAQEWLTQNWATLEPSTQQRLTREQQRSVVSR